MLCLPEVQIRAAVQTTCGFLMTTCLLLSLIMCLSFLLHNHLSLRNVFTAKVLMLNTEKQKQLRLNVTWETTQIQTEIVSR